VGVRDDVSIAVEHDSAPELARALDQQTDGSATCTACSEAAEGSPGVRVGAPAELSPEPPTTKAPKTAATNGVAAMMPA
jgi:hypothetical protein